MKGLKTKAFRSRAHAAHLCILRAAKVRDPPRGGRRRVERQDLAPLAIPAMEGQQGETACCDVSCVTGRCSPRRKFKPNCTARTRQHASRLLNLRSAAAALTSQAPAAG